MAFFSASGVRRLLHRCLLSTSATPDPIPFPHLRRLARAGRLDDIDIALAPLVPSHADAAILTLSSLGLPDRASSLLASLPIPSASHLNALLAPLLRRRRLARLVPSLLAAHPSAPRDANTFSILAKSLCLSSGAASALHLLDSSPPSVPFFTTLIDSFYKEGLPHRAEELWHKMVHDHHLQPDVVAHNVRIVYKSSSGTVEEVRELIQTMSEGPAGLRPDVVTFNALMRAMIRHGRVDEAVGVYRGLEAEGCEANCATYTCVVGALCSARRLREAEDVFYEGVKKRMVVNLWVVRALVLGLKEAGKGRAARRVVVGLRKKFPEEFDGPWKQLEELAGLQASKEDGEDEEGDDGGEQQAMVPAA